MIAAMLQGENTPCTLFSIDTQDRRQRSSGLCLMVYQQSANEGASGPDRQQLSDRKCK
jgi:hypothetical protein